MHRKGLARLPARQGAMAVSKRIPLEAEGPEEGALNVPDLPAGRLPIVEHAPTIVWIYPDTLQRGLGAFLLRNQVRVRVVIATARDGLLAALVAALVAALAADSGRLLNPDRCAAGSGRAAGNCLPDLSWTLFINALKARPVLRNL